MLVLQPTTRLALRADDGRGEDRRGARRGAAAAARNAHLRRDARPRSECSHDAGISAGSIVLLSDGADGGSSRLAAQLGTESPPARRARVRRRAAVAGFDAARSTTSRPGRRRRTPRRATPRTSPGSTTRSGAGSATSTSSTTARVAPLGARVDGAGCASPASPGRATAAITAPTFAARRPDRPRTSSGPCWIRATRPRSLAFAARRAASASSRSSCLRPGAALRPARIAGFVAGDQRRRAVDSRPRRPPALTQTADAIARGTRAGGRVQREVELAARSGHARPARALDRARHRCARLPARCRGRATRVGGARAWGSRSRRRGGPRAGDASSGARSATSCPTTCRCVASAMRAGHSFLGALSVVAEDAAEPSRREFRRVVADEQLGVPVETALAAVAERMSSKDVEHVGARRAAAARDRRQHRGGARPRHRDDPRAHRAAAARPYPHRAGPARRLDRVGAARSCSCSLLNLLNPGYMRPAAATSTGGMLARRRRGSWSRRLARHPQDRRHQGLRRHDDRSLALGLLLLRGRGRAARARVALPRIARDARGRADRGLRLRRRRRRRRSRRRGARTGSTGLGRAARRPRSRGGSGACARRTCAASCWPPGMYAHVAAHARSATACCAACGSPCCSSGSLRPPASAALVLVLLAILGAASAGCCRSTLVRRRARAARCDADRPRAARSHRPARRDRRGRPRLRGSLQVAAERIERPARRRAAADAAGADDGPRD